MRKGELRGSGSALSPIRPFSPPRVSPPAFFAFAVDARCVLHVDPKICQNTELPFDRL